MARFKLQSAMEYLMTYGWAILIIAIVIVALVSIGVFNGPAGTKCISVSGFTCQVSQYSSVSGNLIVIVGQATGISWSTATIYFVNSTLEPSVISSEIPAGLAGNTLPSGMPSGVSETVSLPVTGANSAKVNAQISGYVWASYTTGVTGTVQTQIGTVSAKAT